MVEIYLCSIHFIIFLSCVYVGNYLKLNDKYFYYLVSFTPILNIYVLIYSIYFIKK